MKKKDHAPARLFALLLAGFTALSITVAATGTAGTVSDPLVTLSYLNGTFLPELLGTVDEKLAARSDKTSQELSAQMEEDLRRLEEEYGAKTSEGGSVSTADGFSVVTLTEGQTLYGAVGCEVMLRVGSAVVTSPSAPGLIDSTDGTTLNDGGSLVKNHLYMMTIDERGVKAASATTKLLVRGECEIK